MAKDKLQPGEVEPKKGEVNKIVTNPKAADKSALTAFDRALFKEHKERHKEGFGFVDAFQSKGNDEVTAAYEKLVTHELMDKADKARIVPLHQKKPVHGYRARD